MIRKVISILVSIAATLMIVSIVSAQAGLPPLTTYTQNFDTLANTGTSTTVPTGWAFSEAGSNANTTYTAGTGSGTTGDTYSFGAASATDRAFGGLQSGTLIPTIGVQFQNNTGGTIGRLVIAYNCEQWRLGTTGRADRLDFQYSTDATSLSTGTWADFDALDCPSFTTGTVGALDGNTNRTAVGGTVTGLNIPTGSNFWLRWTDFNATGSDDGLGVDDFSLQLQSPTAITLSTFSGRTPANDGWIVLILLVAGMLLIGGWALRRRSQL